MYPQNITKSDIEEILLNDIEQMDDHLLVEYGYKLQSVWDNADVFDGDLNITLLRQRMREVYLSVLKRAQETKDLERLATLVPSLPYLIYCPDLPDEEDCFEPVDDLVWGFTQTVSKHEEVSEVSEAIRKAAINALMVETKDIDLEDLMAEPVYIWALNHM